ncbi:sensor domain-containing diguanylate cyclase [Pseudoduganella namucuonensis]|uniref:diguanylate cyclase n=1 Tax=Pseudoduganella namucuonensis TaxID=1035707 RepID=A0A1I7JFV1_9BURK|nr:sensor domain-containing diguanylate cyclase [Pseudoduganella namucuonensis]SFU84069.1 diguanylate cyclase (GGDEF) domain-containing protein [Pseudoduganella namucuonensis]
MINDFAEASKACLAFLHDRLGFQLWMVTRTEGDDWIVLSALDEGYGIKPGQVFRWSDSFCSRMVQGQGPHIAPRSSDVAAYAAAPIGRRVEIGAYVGLPLTRADGTLFGTLCAIDPSPQPRELEHEQALLKLMADLLSGMLNAELAAADAKRRAERAELDATRDELTGLYNRRGWSLLLNREEERCKRYGHPACVVSVDLDELKFTNDTQGHSAGDALLLRAGEALASLSRSSDVVARLGGDEFAMLLVECDFFDAQQMVQRLQEKLALCDVRASLGMAMRKPGYDLHETFAMADAEMYKAKRGRKLLN